MAAQIVTRILGLGTVFAQDFRVLRELSDGGMGAVYVVEQISTGKERALKVLPPQLVADPKHRERFAQEVRVGGQIKSDHVVEVIGAGIDEETGIPWLAMEFLEGEDLAGLMRRRTRLPPAEVLEILEQVCDALGKAHALGVVHRGLKPENLFIALSRRRGTSHVVKILDFGIAKVVQENRSAATVTSAIGSPVWMSPEQGNRGEEISPATDVWALGLIVFHLLTGRFYWQNANPMCGEFNLTALLVEVMTQPLEAASVRAASLGCEEPLPRGFDAWFSRCLTRDPEARLATADEAITSLREVLSPAGLASQGSMGPTLPTIGPVPTKAVPPPSALPDVSETSQTATSAGAKVSAESALAREVAELRQRESEREAREVRERQEKAALEERRKFGPGSALVIVVSLVLVVVVQGWLNPALKERNRRQQREEWDRITEQVNRQLQDSSLQRATDEMLAQMRDAAAHVDADAAQFEVVPTPVSPRDAGPPEPPGTQSKPP